MKMNATRKALLGVKRWRYADAVNGGANEVPMLTSVIAPGRTHCFLLPQAGQRSEGMMTEITLVAAPTSDRYATVQAHSMATSVFMEKSL